jgi:hypothetical protein
LLDARARCAEFVVQREERHRAALDDYRQLAPLLDRDEAALERLDAGANDQNDDGRLDRRRVQSAADREADGGDRPGACRRGQSAHDLAAQQDRARAEKADARRHLSGHPRRIEHDVLAAQHFGKAVGRHDHDERRTDPGQHVRAQPRRL